MLNMCANRATIILNLNVKVNKLDKIFIYVISLKKMNKKTEILLYSHIYSIRNESCVHMVAD